MIKRARLRLSWPVVVAQVIWASCGSAPEPVNDPTAGPDQGKVDTCLECHQEGVGTAWSSVSSHQLLFDCAQCHVAEPGSSGEGHATSADCAPCHSETLHHAPACMTCHQVHGSTNLFLIREALPGVTVPISLSTAEGASAAGLVRQPGTDQVGRGVCEACHTSTRHYRSDGGGTAHFTELCVRCHTHQTGFAPP